MMELNRIYNESNLDTMQRMPDCFVDLTVTSPPYDNLRDYKGFKFPFKHIARHLYRVTKFGGVVVWVVGDATINGSETGTSFKQALFFKECGFRLHDTMIYAKQNPIPLTHNRYEQAWEYTFVFSKGKPKHFEPITIKTKSALTKYKWNRGASTENGSAARNRNETTVVKQQKIIDNIWSYLLADNDSTDHPAPFPEDLAADHIKSWSNEGDIVYDPFGGSGTTAKMAHLLKRNWILSEISEEYCQIAEKRIRPYLQQTQLF